MSLGKRKNCSKLTSYSCGRTCITVTKECRIDGLKGQGVDIAKKLQIAIAVSKDKTYKPRRVAVDREEVHIDERSGIMVSSIVDGFKLEVKVTPPIIQNNTMVSEIKFMVDGSLSVMESASRESRTLVTGLRLLADEALNRVPEGTVLVAIPYENDGKKLSREKLYRRFGFSANLDGEMRSKKTDGVFTPLYSEETVQKKTANESSQKLLSDMADMIALLDQ